MSEPKNQYPYSLLWVEPPTSHNDPLNSSRDPGHALDLPLNKGNMCCENISNCEQLQSVLSMNLTSSQRPHGDMGAYGSVLCLQIYMIPLIVILGISISTFTCSVLLRTRLRKKFYSHFILAVCVSSSGFLLTVIVDWAFNQKVSVFSIPGLCQMTIFCSHYFPFLSVWVSVVGAMLVLYDMTRQKAVTWMNSPGAAKIWVIGLALFAFTVYSYKTWTHGVFNYKSRSAVCSVIPENESAMRILNMLDMFLLLYLPSCSFLLFDIALFYWTLWRPYKTNDDVYRRRHAEVLKIVLCYSVCFHLMVTPRAVSASIVSFNKWVYRREPTSNDLMVNQVLQILFYLYFAINPIFPFCVSRKFRRSVSVLLSHGCSKDIAMRQLRPPSPTL